jgi:hypothetical protein
LVAEQVKQNTMETSKNRLFFEIPLCILQVLSGKSLKTEVFRDSHKELALSAAWKT